MPADLSLVTERPNEKLELKLNYIFDRLPDSVACMKISPAAKILYADRYNYFVDVMLPAWEKSQRILFAPVRDLAIRTTIDYRRIRRVIAELVTAGLLRVADNVISTRECKSYVPLFYTDGSDIERELKSVKVGLPVNKLVSRHQRFIPVPVMTSCESKAPTRFIDALVSGVYHWATHSYDPDELATVSIKAIARRLGMNRRTVRDSLLRLKLAQSDRAIKTQSSILCTA